MTIPRTTVVIHNVRIPITYRGSDGDHRQSPGQRTISDWYKKMETSLRLDEVADATPGAFSRKRYGDGCVGYVHPVFGLALQCRSSVTSWLQRVCGGRTGNS